MASIGMLSILQNYCFPLFVLYLISSLLRNKFKSSLRDIPGPPLAAYTSLWRLYNVWKGRAHWTAIDLHRKHGKLVRIAPDVVSVGDAEELPKIYNIKGEYTKSAFYPIQSISWKKKLEMNLFSTRSEAEHRQERKKVANAYSLNQLLKMEDAIDDCGRLLISKLSDYAERGQDVDLGSWLQYYAFDVVGELTFGSKLAFLDKGMDVDGMMAAIEGMLVYASHCGQVPAAHGWLLGNPLFTALMPAMETWNQVVLFTLKAINERTRLNRDGELETEEGRAGDDMLSKWAAVKSSDPYKMSTRDIVVHLGANVFAGSDTTAIALRAILYFLVKNPEKMAKLQTEIDEATKAGKVSYLIKDEEARNELPYLNVVIKEAIRLHSSVGLLLERHVPVEGATICGKFLPPGTVVGINPWVLQHDSEVFERPQSFEPERWMLDAAKDKDRLARMEKHFFSFGAGSRVCTGRNISMIEMRKIIPLLVREFDISIEKGKEWKVKNVWFTQQRMPPVLLKLRRGEST